MRSLGIDYKLFKRLIEEHDEMNFDSSTFKESLINALVESTRVKKTCPSRCVISMGAYILVYFPLNTTINVTDKVGSNWNELSFLFHPKLPKSLYFTASFILKNLTQSISH